ncbi:regulator [Actinoplanes sp. LDG1-06]|uniref:Regulator n=2 Tax=Paractinoplanes ovalisporus TaxID=2810368 RepID=A0ABS2AK13_9ACTN|nr:regulator [Actinoplanes ovalisporus]
MTLEAFADTVIPGCKRFPDDPAICGVSDDPGAVEAGALTVLADPALGLTEALDGMAGLLNMHAGAYQRRTGAAVDPALPAFVALAFDDRTALVQELTDPAHAERDVWFGAALFCTMAFDCAPHKHTVEAMAEGHPGLRLLGYAPPGADGQWGFEHFSYGRALAPPHPDTTPSGSPR